MCGDIESCPRFHLNICGLLNKIPEILSYISETHIIENDYNGVDGL